MPSVKIRILIILALAIGLLLSRPKVREGLRNLVQPGLQPPPQQARIEKVEDRPLAAAPKSIGGGLELKQAIVGELSLWYLEGGVGSDTTNRQSVLLLHPFAGDKEQWIPLMGHLLRAGYHVLAPDLPGCGENTKDPEGSYGVGHQSKRLRAFLRRINFVPHHLVGASMGGTIAASLAYNAKSDVRSLTLIEPFGVRVPYETELDQMLGQGRNPMIVAAAAAYDNLRGFLMTSPPESDPYRAKRAQRMADDRLVNLKIWQDVREGEHAHLLDLLLPELKVRTLYLRGESSRVVHPATAELVANMMPSARAAVIAGTGHWPMVEKPEETGTLLVEHFALG